MSFLLWGIGIILVMVFLGRDKKLAARMDRLESVMAGLETELTRLRSQWAAQAPGAEQEASEQAQPLPSVAHAEPPVPEEQIQTAPATMAHARIGISPEPESLEDLDLFAEREASVQDAAVPVLTGAQRLEGEPSVPEGPSRWRARWQAFKASVDWEQFTGVKLFAWLGGLAFFIAAGFFVKVSIDRNWIPPALRLAISALAGVGLIGAAVRFAEETYRVMRHTLTAAGIGVLYSVVFAATLYYTYLTKPIGFGLLVLVSIAAFVLALFHNSRVVAVLGAVGAYATPIMVSSGQDSLPLLLGYLVVVNFGLYRVATRLISHGLILVAAAGTVATLGLGTAHIFGTGHSLTIALVWTLNALLFTYFLSDAGGDPRQNPAARWSGITIFLSALALAVALLAKPGWAPLMVVVVTQALAAGLAWRRPGWYRYHIAYAAVSFLVALAWVLCAFQPAQFTAGFPLLLLYGAFGGMGPLLLVWKYGINRAVLAWFRIFPLAIVLIGLAIIVRQPVVSFWFWPLLLGLELIGIGLSLLFRAFVQVAILMLLFVAGALHWLFHVPAGMLGVGFFAFIMVAGIVLCAGVFLIIKRLPDWVAALNLAGEGAAARLPWPTSSALTQWLAAAPAAGVCVLLAASFLIPYPHYPQPGMATLVCFLALVLAAAWRFGFEIPGVAALVGTVAAQAVFVYHQQLGPPVYFPAQIWAGALFLAALPAPFILFSATRRWPRIWNGWALFEAVQAIFLLYVSQRYWTGPEVKWVPMALAVFKLPFVALLLRRLNGRPERNAILAFHGGVLLFYLSTQPVLVLNHGWIGLTFVFEGTALLWLNRRIAHPGLRWVALCMAPAGLLILCLNLPLLKTVESLPLANSAFGALAAAVVALVLAVRQAGHPRRRLASLDLPNCFLWMAVASGFVLVNLAVADLFARPGARFALWPGRDFVQWACYGLAWVALGVLLRRLVHLPAAVRLTGLGLVAAGALGLTALPVLLPEAAMAMRPLANVALALYLPLLVVLCYLFHKEDWDDDRSLPKNIVLALLLLTALITFKFQKSIFVAPGYPFALLTSKTAALATSSAAGWLIYGLGLLLWPKRLDRPFRLTGVGLIVLALFKALILPFKFRVAFAQMTPLFNAPSLVFFFFLAALVYLTARKWDQRWPLSAPPRWFWGILLAVVTFIVLNIEIASVFAIKGRAFSMLTHGSLSMQLAYSIGWLLFAVGLMVVGIRWKLVYVRRVAIAAIFITAAKICLLDVRSLGSLYRVGSFLGLAVVLILISFLYQRFLSEGNKDA